MKRTTWTIPRGVLFGGVLLAAIFGPRALMGQIRIGLRTEHEEVLQFEAIQTYITVHNDSSAPLTVGDESGPGGLTLRFVIEDSNGLPETEIRDAPLCRRETLLPGTRRTFLLDVTKWFRMVGLGRYQLLVEGHWDGERYESNPVRVNVVSGLVQTEVKKRLSGYRDRVRHYSLRYWRRDQHEHLFLRVDELVEDRLMNYGTIDLGRVIRVFKPRLAVDNDGGVKVVHQSGRNCYTRTLFLSDPDRLRFVDQTYHLPNGDPYPNLAGRRAAPAEEAEDPVDRPDKK